MTFDCILIPRLEIIELEFNSRDEGAVVEEESRLAIKLLIMCWSACWSSHGDRSSLFVQKRVISVTEMVMKLRHMRMALTTQMRKGL